MSRVRPLPPSLDIRGFTVAEAHAAGVSASRLRANDLTCPTNGVRVSSEAIPDPVSIAWAVASQHEGAWLSHTTAARAFGIKVRGSSWVHISRPRGSRATQRGGVIGHQRNVEPDEITTVRGMRVSTPERMWLEMGQYLSTTELVVLGDQLVRCPRAAFEKRNQPWTSISRLRELLRRHPRTRGIRSLRAALERVRVGADSEPETLCRLALVDDGLPEPALQVRLDPDDPYSHSADLAYPDLKLAIQYDGHHHFSAEQQARDARRDAAFEAQGWTVFHVNRADLRDGFRALCARVRQFMVAFAPVV